MDKRISIIGTGLNLAGVLIFALCMITGPLSLCYIASIFIAWGLVIMNAGFYRYGRTEARVAALCALSFGAMYAICNTAVYFTQLSTVARGGLSAEAAMLLDYRSFSLMFDYDMLGYCLMAISTFFAGFTIVVKDRGDRWLKGLLLVHGIFAISCFIMPLLGLFSSDMEGADWIGTLVLELWCAFFTPIGILGIRYFVKKEG
jgi:hypothetical protein